MGDYAATMKCDAKVQCPLKTGGVLLLQTGHLEIKSNYLGTRRSDDDTNYYRTSLQSFGLKIEICNIHTIYNRRIAVARDGTMT